MSRGWIKGGYFCAKGVASDELWSDIAQCARRVKAGELLDLLIGGGGIAL